MQPIARGEQRGNGAVIELAGARAASVAATESAEVGAQQPVAERLAVLQLQVLLAVDVLQLGVPQAEQAAFAIEAIFAAGEIEAVGSGGWPAEQRHVLHACVVARAVAAELAGVEGQAGDLVGAELAAAEGLRQRAAIVGAEDRHPFADLQFAVRDAQLAGHRQASEVVGRAAVVVDRQQLGAGRSLATIQLQAVETEDIEAEADAALGEAGAGVEDEALRPLLGLALAGIADEVAVQVEIARGEAGLGVFEETLPGVDVPGMDWQAGAQAEGSAERADVARVRHGCVPSFLFSRQGGARRAPGAWTQASIRRGAMKYSQVRAMKYIAGIMVKSTA